MSLGNALILSRDDRMTDKKIDAQAGIQTIEFLQKAIPSLYSLKHYRLMGHPITFTIKGHDPDDRSTWLDDPRGINHRPFQPKMLDDTHPNKVYEKGRQIGGSELAIIEELHFLDYYSPVSAMDVFPRWDQTRKFVMSRLDPLFKKSKYFGGIIDPHQNTQSLKKIRDSYLYFGTAWGSEQGESTHIDALFLDEYDRMKDNVESAFEESMSSSRFKWLRRWSTPTIPGRGINKLFQNSDQQFWFHKCPICGYDQRLTVKNNIVQINKNGIDLETNQVKPGTFDFVCAKCHNHLDRWYNGHWVAEFPERAGKDYGIRGYHISQLNCVWHTADSIMQRQFDYDSVQLFYNYVIGEPYAAGGLVVNLEDLIKAKRYEKPILSRDEETYSKVTVGIDWGPRNWAVALGLRPSGQIDLLNLWMFRDNPSVPLQGANSIAGAIVPYNPDFILADYGYGADRNSYMMQAFRGKVWACKFMNYKDASQPIDQWNKQIRIVSVDKTLKMQRLLHSIKSRRIGMWEMDDKLRILYKHLSNIRIMDEEDHGVTYQIATRVGDDHFACALCYALIAMEKIINPYQQKSQNYL